MKITMGLWGSAMNVLVQWLNCGTSFVVHRLLNFADENVRLC